MLKKLLALMLLLLFSLPFFQLNAFAEETQTYLKPVINIDSAIEVQKSTIFDASLSFLPKPERNIIYKWDFGDGNHNEGVEVLHAYQNSGYHTLTLTIIDGKETAKTTMDIFVYTKSIILITDQTEDADRMKIIKDFAEKKGVYLKIIESFGSSTEFISEEILTKKLTEENNNIQKSKEIVIWTKENAGMNALSRFIQSAPKKNAINLSQKNILVVEEDIGANVSRIQRQFNLIFPKSIIVAKEAAFDDLIESSTEKEFFDKLQERGRSYEVIDASSGKIRPWNFMSYFVNILIDRGIPDNTIALLLLLPVIATVIAVMRQIIGITTFGIYTPSIITLSFLVIGLYAGLLTLLTAIAIGTLARLLLIKVRMLFIPKMAIVITVVALNLLLVLIASIYLNLFNAAFLSIAIFPMLILSTLVEKFVTAKSEKNYSSASVLMVETLIVSIIAYFVAGGAINLGFTIFKFEFIKNLMLTYPESVFLFIIINILLGKWSGLRVLERIRFREVLRHIEEE